MNLHDSSVADLGICLEYDCISDLENRCLCLFPGDHFVIPNYHTSPRASFLSYWKDSLRILGLPEDVIAYYDQNPDQAGISCRGSSRNPAFSYVSPLGPQTLEFVCAFVTQLLPVNYLIIQPMGWCTRRLDTYYGRFCLRKEEEVLPLDLTDVQSANDYVRSLGTYLSRQVGSACGAGR